MDKSKQDNIVVTLRGPVPWRACKSPTTTEADQIIGEVSLSRCDLFKNTVMQLRFPVAILSPIANEISLHVLATSGDIEVGYSCGYGR